MPHSSVFPDTALATPLLVGLTRMRIEDVVAVAHEGRTVELSQDSAFRGRVEASASFLNELLEQGADVYGVNTGYGDNCTILIPPALVNELPMHLTVSMVVAWVRF